MTSNIIKTKNFYMALHTKYPITEEHGTECTFGGYARQPAGNFIDLPTVPGWSLNTNADRIVFPECTHGKEMVRYFGIHTEQLGGVLLFAGEFDDPRMVIERVRVVIEPGRISIQMENDW